MATELQIEQIERWQESVFRLAYARMGNRHDAEDICQEVFLRYLNKNPEFESDEHAKAWFLRVTLNRCNSFFRSAFFRRTVPLEKDFPKEGNVSVASLDLDRAMKKMSKKYRTVIHLYYYEDLTVKKIAEILGIGESAVRMQLTRARKELKNLMGGEDMDV